VLSEFGQDTTVIMADERGQVVQEMSLSDLLPGAFGPQDLNASP
jgi:cytidine deaminase